MKCGVCGKKIPKGATVCPGCGRPAAGGSDDFSGRFSGGGFSDAGQGDFGFSGGDDGFSGGSFDPAPQAGGFSDGFDAPRPAPSPAKKKGVPRLPLLLAAAAVVIGALVFLLLPRQKESAAQVLGFSAPSGAWEEIGRDSMALTNELLITGADTLDQAGLEALLQEVDGAVVGYFPLLRQYQVRFNTDSLAALDAVKAKIEGGDGILQIDYNLILSLRGGETAAQALPAVPSGVPVGLMAAALPDGVTAGRYFLPSHSFADEQVLNAALVGHTEGERAANAASAWGTEADLLFAHCFYIEQTSDGAVTLTATSAALRYQVACLAQAGARVIDLPYGCVSQWPDEWTAAEARQWEQLFAALQSEGRDFLICKAEEALPGRDGDGLTQALRAASGGRLLTAGACGTDALPVQDLAGVGLPVYAAEATGDAELCFPGPGSGTASAAAAGWAARMSAETPGLPMSEIKERLLRGFSALAADEQGRVLPVIDGALGASDAACETLAVSTWTAADGVTGLPVRNARFQWGDAAPWTAAEGVARVLIIKEERTVRAQAEGYADGSAHTAGEGDVTVPLTPAHADTGTARGTVSDASSALREVTVSIRNVTTGDVYPDRSLPLSYSVTLYPGEYEMTFSAHDRTSVTLYRVTVTAGQTTENPPVYLSVPSDLPGKAEGIIKDALTGDALEGAALAFYPGADAADSGAPVATASSAGNGHYSVTLPGGMYTAYVSKDGYRTGKLLARSVGERTTGNQNLSITPLLPEGQVRIVLEWGATPSDLDSHLVNKQHGIHIYYSNKEDRVSGRVVANLDVDDISSYGPETTTILQQLNGVYTFYIQDFTNHGSTASCRQMADSGATVTVYVGDQEAQVFRVPDKDGTLWEVFTLENGVITPVNTVTYFTGVETVGQ